MANELKPIQSIQNPSAVTAAPVAVNFSDLPQDVQSLILGRIWQAKDVANLNLVSKWIKTLNQEPIVAAPRLEALFFNTYGAPYHYENHSYRDYIREHSFPGANTSVLGMIESQFPKSPDTVGRQLAPLNSEIRSFLLSKFQLLRTGSQLKALLAISSSFNKSQEITKLFYDALPAAVQKELRWQIWNANGPEGKSSVTSDGIDRGFYFGEHIIANEINSSLVRTAIVNYLPKFGVEVPDPLLGKGGGLPDEVQLRILAVIFEPKDVANLNLVSKSIKALNQHPGAIVDARIQALFTEGMYGFLVLNIGANPAGDSYQDYVWAYCDSRGRVVREFYNALPNDMKNELGSTIWVTNGFSDRFMGIRYGMAFEDRMIQYYTGEPLVRAALRRYLSNLGVDTSINS